MTRLCYAAEAADQAAAQNRSSGVKPGSHPHNAGEHQEAIMAKGNSSQKKETKKPKKEAPKKAAKESK